MVAWDIQTDQWDDSELRNLLSDFQIQSELMTSSMLPEIPWDKIGTDLFELKGKSYLLLVGYFLRYIEVVKLTYITTKTVVAAMKPFIARHSILDVVLLDNGPFYSSREYQQVAKDYEFRHVTCSPYHPQENREAEHAVETVKKLLKDTSNHNLVLLTYQSMPLSWCKHSLAEL